MFTHIKNQIKNIGDDLMSYESVENYYQEQLHNLQLKLDNIKRNENVNLFDSEKRAFIKTYDMRAFKDIEKKYKQVNLEYRMWKYEINNENSLVQDVKNAWESLLDQLNEEITEESKERPCPVITRDKDGNFNKEWTQDLKKINELTEIYKNEKFKYEKWLLKEDIC